MPDDPIRLQILDALDQKLRAITVAAGYRYTVATVELAARGFDETEVRQAVRPWLGIVPQEERITELQGHSVCDWAVELLAYVTPAERSARSIAQACAGIHADIRRAVYADPTLGVDGVIWARIEQRLGSEGSPQAAEDNVAAISLKLTIRFEEAHDAA